MTAMRTVARKQATTGTMAALFVFLALLSGTALVAAQAPPAPPARFVGTVMVNGTPAAPGTVVEARVGSASCGTTTVFTSGSDARYAIDVAGADPANAPGCGADNAVVSFWVGGVQAAQTGTWVNFDLNTLNLTAGGAAATPTAVASTPTVVTTATVAPTSSGGGVQPTVAAVATPRPPSTGTGDTTGAGSDSLVLWLGVAMMLTAAAGGGLYVARKR